MLKTALSLAILTALAHMPADPPRILRLADGDGAPRRVMSNTVELAEGVSRSWVTVTRTGSFTDPRYGRFEITNTMLSQMVRNFDAGVVGLDIFIDVDHKPGDGAAAKVLALKVDNGRLRAQVEWTEYGTAAVRTRGFRYLSAEFHEDFHDNEQNKAHGCVLLGAGLTIRPVVKRLDPVTLSVTDPSSGPVFVHPGLVRQLTESLENTAMNRWEKFLAALKAGGITLSASHLAALKSSFETGAKALADDADDADFIAQWVSVGKALATAGEGATVQLSVQNPTAQIGAEEIATAVAKALADQKTLADKGEADTTTKKKLFTDTLEANKGLSEDTRTQLAAVSVVITGAWSDGQVKELAEKQIAIGEKIESNKKLAAVGYRPVGQVHLVSVDDSNEIRSLSESIRKSLASTSAADNGMLRLTEEDKLPGFVQRVLAQFDAENGHRMNREIKALANGQVDTGDMNVPATFQREVLKEALSDLNILALIDAAVEPTTGATHSIPFENRDVSAVRNGGTTYEGQPINYAGVNQDSEFAYIEPTKLAINLTNEVMFFSANNPNINWDAYARTTASCSRVVGELLHRRIGNGLQRAADSFGAIKVAAFEAVPAGTVAGNYKFANWPVVRPYQARDLKGNAVGLAENPLVVRVAGAPIGEFDGTGTQAAGNYYVMNWNLGVVTVVTQLGVPVGALVVTSTYSYATNVSKVDVDVPGGTTYERHLNKVLQAIGSRKAILSQERFVTPNASLLAPTLADTISNAEQFEAAAHRADASILSTGDLGPIKGIPSWKTNAPGLDIAEDRMLIFERGLLRYRIAKTFAIGAPFEMVDPATGRPIGKKQAYGEEYSSIHVPTPLRGRATSLIVYSVAARAAL